MRSALALAVLAFAPAALAQAADAGAADAGPEFAATPPQVFSTDGGSPDDEGAGLPRYTLAKAVERAMAQNPTAQNAASEVGRASALVVQARAGWFPNLNLNAAYLRLDGDRLLAGRVISAKDQFAGNLGAQVPIFNAQKWYPWWRARDAVSVAQLNEQDARRAVAINTARAYLTIVTDRRIIEVNRRAAIAAQAHLDFATARFKGGVGNRVDVVRAAQELATTNQRLEQARTGLARAREALGVLLAEPGPVDVTEVPELQAPALQAALDETEQRRPDLLAQATRAANADRAVHDHWTDFTPILAAAAQAFYQNPATLTTPQTGWQAQLLLTWPLYDGGLRYGQQQERRLLAVEAHTTQEGNDRQALADVRASFDSVSHADAALLAARDAARLAHESLSLVNLAYAHGATTNIEVIDAERSALDADTAAATAEDDARQARLDLLAASGRFP